MIKGLSATQVMSPELAKSGEQKKKIIKGLLNLSLIFFEFIVSLFRYLTFFFFS